MEEPLAESGQEVSSPESMDDSEDINRWLDDIDGQDQGDAEEWDAEGRYSPDEPEEAAEEEERPPKRTRIDPREVDWDNDPNVIRLPGGPPAGVEPGYNADGTPIGAPPPPEPHRAPRRARQSREIPRPVEMTKAEMEQHRRGGHANHHLGCKHCLKGGAVADQHSRAKGGDDEDGRLPIISADLCFMGSEESENKLVTLVMVDDKSDILFSHPSPDKAIVRGEHSEYMLNKVVDDINSLGYGKVTLKTDQEVAMTSLQCKVQKVRERPVILMNSPKGD